MNSKSYFCIAFGPYELYVTKNVYDTENDFLALTKFQVWTIFFYKLALQKGILGHSKNRVAEENSSVG